MRLFSLLFCKLCSRNIWMHTGLNKNIISCISYSCRRDSQNTWHNLTEQRNDRKQVLLPTYFRFPDNAENRLIFSLGEEEAISIFCLQGMRLFPCFQIVSLQDKVTCLVGNKHGHLRYSHKMETYNFCTNDLTPAFVLFCSLINIACIETTGYVFCFLLLQRSLPPQT